MRPGINDSEVVLGEPFESFVSHFPFGCLRVRGWRSVSRVYRVYVVFMSCLGRVWGVGIFGPFLA
jgi:hypothetical protein